MANTPNLDLVKPAGTDKALVSVINSNSDKIDAGFGSLSDQIETKKFLGENAKNFGVINSGSGSTDIDALVDSFQTSAGSGKSLYFSADLKYGLTNPVTNANRNFVYGFINDSKKYGWVIIESFGKEIKGTRNNSSTFTFECISDNVVRAFGDRKAMTFSLSYNRKTAILHIASEGNRWGIGIVLIADTAWVVYFNGSGTIVTRVCGSNTLTVTYSAQNLTYTMTATSAGQFSGIFFGGFTSNATIEAGAE